MSTSVLHNSRADATSATAASTASKTAKRQKEAGHRIRVIIAGASACLLVAAISIYGASYYLLPLNERPYSEKYELLKPGGSIGLKLGILGTVLFFIIFMYALRKVIPFLGRFGTARHWMDFHVIAGVTAPIVIAFHASFKFRGIAGIAFWIMLAVALSGVIGRYLYAQIPRSLSAAEISLTELHVSERELAEALLGQSVYSAEQLNRAMHVPSAEHIRSIGPLLALGEMIVLDVRLPFRMAGLRRTCCNFGTKVLTIGGLLSSGHSEVELVVHLVKQKASLSKRVVFLGQSQKVFHLWHVIHRPFSYAFAVLAIIHIAVVMGFGFVSLGFH
jgi:hypothetical protein